MVSVMPTKQRARAKSPRSAGELDGLAAVGERAASMAAGGALLGAPLGAAGAAVGALLGAVAAVFVAQRHPRDDDRTAG
jgi:succinate dehydrogenase/fumarate reductase flavoprotein subunit